MLPVRHNDKLRRGPAWAMGYVFSARERKRTDGAELTDHGDAGKPDAEL